MNTNFLDLPTDVHMEILKNMDNEYENVMFRVLAIVSKKTNSLVKLIDLNEKDGDDMPKMSFKFAYCGYKKLFEELAFHRIGREERTIIREWYILGNYNMIRKFVHVGRLTYMPPGADIPQILKTNHVVYYFHGQHDSIDLYDREPIVIVRNIRELQFPQKRVVY